MTDWTPPAEAVCAEEGCTLPPAGVRPLSEEVILEDAEGVPYGVLVEADEVVCAEHARGEQPDGTVL